VKILPKFGRIEPVAGAQGKLRCDRRRRDVPQSGELDRFNNEGWFRVTRAQRGLMLAGHGLSRNTTPACPHESRHNQNDQPTHECFSLHRGERVKGCQELRFGCPPEKSARRRVRCGGLILHHSRQKMPEFYYRSTVYC